MKHILGSCVLAGLFLFCACDDTLDTKVTWQIGDSDTWRVPELAQGVLYKACLLYTSPSPRDRG